MKNISVLRKMVCCILALAFAFPYVASVMAFANGTDDEYLTNDKKAEIEAKEEEQEQNPNSSSKYERYLSRTIGDAYSVTGNEAKKQELRALLDGKTYFKNDWWYSRWYDGIPYNRFHNEVQKDIRNVQRKRNNNKNFKEKEMTIKYKKNAKSDKDLKKYDASADLWETNDSKEKVYLWEVKPSSYAYGKKNNKKGREQLANYVKKEKILAGNAPFDENTINYANYNFEFGADGGTEIEDGEFYLFDTVEHDDCWEKLLYDVTYEVQDDSLIVYNFKRYVMDKKDKDDKEKKKKEDDKANNVPKPNWGDNGVSKENSSEKAKIQVTPGGKSSKSSQTNPQKAPSAFPDEFPDAAIIPKAPSKKGKNVYSPIADRYISELCLKSIAGLIIAANINGRTSVQKAEQKYAEMYLAGMLPGADFADFLFMIYDNELFDKYDQENIYEDSIAGKDIESQNDLDGQASNAIYDPLILDLDNNGYDINTKNEGSYFDLNCDGFAERINWTTTDVILAIDKNANGKIDDGNEVFGDSFVLESGAKAENGFAALSQYDSNSDGIINSKDKDFENLLLWLDTNGNGKSDEGELSTLSDNNISTISLSYETINQLTESEAIIGNESYFEYSNGSTGKIGEMWVSSDLYDALETICEEPTAEIAGLPNVRSFGKVNSLHTAMVKDSTGRLKELVKNFTQEYDRGKRVVIVEEILSIMCKTEDIDSSSRGNYIDAKHLAVIETVLGRGFFGTNGADPNPTAAILLEQIYSNIVNTYYFAMLSSRVYTYIDLIAENENEDGSLSYDLSNFNDYMVKCLKNETIDDNTFIDVCAYLNYFSTVMLGNHSLVLEFIDQISIDFEDHLPLVYNSIYDAIKGTAIADDINGTDQDDLIFSDDGNDRVSSGNGNDCILGYGDSDVLYGENGNDILDGGSGNDTLYGSYGDDTYRFGRGYGKDTINEQNKNSNGDKVVFIEGIKTDDIVLSRNGNDMILTIKDTDDSLRIVNQYWDSYYKVESFEFADGTKLSADDWFNMSLVINGRGEIKDYDNGYGTRNTFLNGSDADDTIYGYFGDDILDGGIRNDTLYGGYGDDTYKFGRGYGQDIINEQNKNSNGDKVVFGENITADDIVLSRTGNDMILTIKDTDDSLRIVNQYWDSYYRIEIFEFADGTKILTEVLYNTSLIITGSGIIEDYDSGYGARNTTLIGSKNDDFIFGYSGNDILDGGEGNDLLYGGYGDDIYKFGKGYGHDTINEQNKNSKGDKVIFGEGITADDIVLSRNGNDMVLTIKDTDDSLRIVNQYWDSYYKVESFEFADGTKLSADDWFNMSLVINGRGEIKDYDNGYGTRNTFLNGSDADDTIYGYFGNDILDGDAGNDTLYGGYGDDTYKFGRGYGQDIIDEQNKNSKGDKVVFGEGITVDDIVLSRDGNDMVLTIKNTDDSLRIVNQYWDSYYRIETFEFADGTLVSSDYWYDIELVINGSGEIKDYDNGYGTRNTTLNGSDADDTIYGYFGDDILDGGTGNDTLYGGYGDDTYKFGRGYGQDIIDEQNKNSKGDKVVFGEGITADDIVLNRDGNDMILTIKDTDDSLRIVNQYWDSYYRIETFEFADRTLVSADYWYDIMLVINGSGKIEDYDNGYGTRNNTLNGSDADDIMYGYSGDDVLDGGTGNDALYGGYGDDTYKFGRGYGQDIIDEQNKNSKGDKVVFGEGITADDIVLNRDGNDMVLTIKNTDDSLRIVNQYWDSYYRIELFEFNDGTIKEIEYSQIVFKEVS